MESAPTGRLDTPSVALVTPAGLVVTGELPRGRASAKNETDPVGSPPDVGLITAVNPTGCPKSEPAGTELVTRVTVVTAGDPPISPSSSACE